MKPPTLRPGPSLYRNVIQRDERPPETAVGVVVPFDFELDWEYWRYLPERVSLYFTRTPYLNLPVGVRLARQVGSPKVVAGATRALTSLNPSVTLYACSSGSFIRGLEGEDELRRSMLAAGAKQAVTTSGAMIEALRSSGIRRVAVATPYTERLTTALADFLEEANFEVVSSHYLGLSHEIGTVSKSTIADLVRTANRPEADAVYVSCTALRTHGIVAMLETELHCPVFTSNQVSLWAALDTAGALNQYEDYTPTLGDAQPMARSTAMLLDVSRNRAMQQAG